MRGLAGVVALLGLWCAACAQRPAEPVWTAVPLPLRFNYHGSPRQQPLGPSRPYVFYFPGRFNPGEKAMPDQLGCQNNRFAPPFWYERGRKMTGPRQVDVPAVGAVHPTGDQKIRGLAFLGTFVRGRYPGVNGAVFYSDNHCYMGTLEYGFIREYSHDSGYTQFYYMQYANCPATGPIECHGRDSAAPETMVRTCASGLNLPDLGDAPAWYRAFVFRDRGGKHMFQVEVVDPKTQARRWQCTVDPSAADPFQGCSGGYRQNTCGANFPISSLYRASGAVTATLNSTNAVLPVDTVAMRIEEVRVAK